jgi:hypothetical protein
MTTRDWAIRAAAHDSAYLITPKARERAITILVSDNSPEADAARVILYDGMAQQGGIPMRAECTLSEWSEAVEVLECR